MHEVLDTDKKTILHIPNVQSGESTQDKYNEVNTIIDSFDHDLDGEVTSVTRFVDMVVLINPAIEASRFEPVRSAAMKRVEYCLRATPDNHIRCERPAYQGAVLAIFTSEGDLATKTFFPIGAILMTLPSRM